VGDWQQSGGFGIGKLMHQPVSRNDDCCGVGLGVDAGKVLFAMAAMRCLD